MADSGDEDQKFCFGSLVDSGAAKAAGTVGGRVKA